MHIPVTFQSSKSLFSVFVILGAFLFCYSYFYFFDIPYYLDDMNVILSAHQIVPSTDILISIKQRAIAASSFVFVWGENQAGNHRSINLLIHIANGLLVFIFALTVLKNKWFALLSSLIWLVHPINSQAVLYVAQRFTLMSCFFSLCALNLWMVFFQKSNFVNLDVKAAFRVTFQLVCCLAFIALAMMSKQNAVILPLLLFFYALINSQRPLVFSFAACIFLSLLILTLYLVSPDLFVLVDTMTRETASYDRLTYFATQMSVWIEYWIKLFFPINLQLENSIELIEFASTSFFIYLILNLSILTVLFISAKIFKDCWFVTLASFFVLAMSIESSFIPIEDLYFEHRFYLPSVFALLGITLLLSKVSLKYRLSYPLFFILPIVLIALSVKTHNRVNQWLDPVVFYQNEFRLSPDNPRVLHNMAIFEHQNGNKLIALKHATQAFNQLSAQGKLTLSSTSLLLDFLLEQRQLQALQSLSMKLVQQKDLPPSIKSIAFSRAARSYAVQNECGFSVGWSKRALSLDNNNKYALETLEYFCQ